MRAMKDSGIPWIGQIPEGWKIVMVKNLFAISRGRVIAVTEMSDNGEYPVFSSQTDNNGCMGYIDTYDYDGDAITWTTDGAKAGTVFYREGKFNCTNICGVLRKKDGIHSNLHYFTYAIGHSADVNKRPDINGFKIMSNEMAVLITILPPLSEQERIADFLDTKCAEIDEMIALQEKTVEELKAYKQSVITEAVTKGLNPDAPMKDSGIPWIGLIPQGWIVNKMLRIAEVITDYVASGSFADLAGNVTYLDYPDYAMLVRTIDVSGKGKNASRVYIDEHAYKFLSNSNLHGGELMLPSIGAVGDIYIVPKLYEFMSLAPNAIMMRTNQCDKYYYYYFLGKGGRTSLLDIAQSTAQPKFNKTDFRALKVIMPPLSEQQAIAAYLDEKCAEIDNLIEIKQQKAEELKAYKKSLIYEYVTGKKEVV